MRRLVVAASLVLIACSAPGEGTRVPSTPEAPSPSVVPSPPADAAERILVAVGDIACAPGTPRTRVQCHHEGTAALLERDGPLGGRPLVGVLLLGDLQYERGLPEEYRSFDASWGRVLERPGLAVLPVAGNHEYGIAGDAPPGCHLVEGDRHACGFLGYFRPRSEVLDDGDADFSDTFGDAERHPLVVVGVDVARCELRPEACRPDGPVVRSLLAVLTDPLTNPPEACTIVAWHEPRWSEVGHGDQPSVDPVWRALFETPGPQRPDLVLNGHDHLYERYPPLGPSGERAPSGIPEIVAGAGGRSIGGLPFTTPPFGGLAAIDASSFGVLAVRWTGGVPALRTTFVTETGDVRDPARHPCHL